MKGQARCLMDQENLNVFDAAFRGDVDTLRVLFEQDQNIWKTLDDDRARPLHHAARGGHLEAVKFMIFNHSYLAGKDKVIIHGNLLKITVWQYCSDVCSSTQRYQIARVHALLWIRRREL